LSEYYNDALLIKYFNLGWSELEYELPWHRYYVLLAVALDLDERDQHFRYVLAGGDPKKFKWGSPDRAGTDDSSSMWDKVVRKAGKVAQGDISYIAQDHWERIKEVTKTFKNGMTRTRYYNEHGEEVTDKVERMQKSGHYFMKTRKGQSD
jgi:hypothetical protein